MSNLLYRGEIDEWPGAHRRWEWLCRCGAEVSVVWSASCSLYDTDEAIVATDADTDYWKLECHNGHVLLFCHELADLSGDTYPAPTTQEIVERLASADDVAAWRASWSTVAEAPEPEPTPQVVDLMAALEASLAATRAGKPA